MNKDQILGIVRSILLVIGGLFVSKGMISAGTLDWAIGGVLSTVPVVWSWWSNRPAAVAASAQKIEGVNVQVSASAPEGVKTAVANAKSGA